MTERSGPCEAADASVMDASVASTSQALTGDADGDGVPDAQDNCPRITNANQLNSNQAGPGDACELALVLLKGNGGRYARFGSLREAVTETAPFTLSGNPDLLRVRALEPAGAVAYQFKAQQDLGVQSPGEQGNGHAKTIEPSEALELRVGEDPGLGGAKASDVYLRLDGDSTVQVTLLDGSSVVGSFSQPNVGTNLARFSGNGALFDRVVVRVTSGHGSLRGASEAVIFTLANADLSCPSGYEPVGNQCVDIDECAA